MTRALVRNLRIGASTMALASVFACADSDLQVEPPAVPLENDGGSPPPSRDAGSDADAAVTVPRERCSAAGWCKSTLPSDDLRLVDISALEDHAFMIGDSPTRGVKFLEWNRAADQWSYIDDGSQNERYVDPDSVWAPSGEEVYVTVTDRESTTTTGLPPPTLVFHGKRPTAPATKWTWTKQQFDCDFFAPASRVWGTGPDDVYLTTCGKIHRRQVDAAEAGAESWAIDYSDGDPPSPGFFEATGTAPDDIWFVGSRGWFPGCTVLLHKTASGYRRVADSTPDESGACVAIDGALTLAGRFDNGMIAPARGTLLGVPYSLDPNNEIVRVTAAADGYSIRTTRPPSSLPVNTRSIWAKGDVDDVWLIGCPGGGCTVVHGIGAFGDNSQFQYSTLAMNGTPNILPLVAIRGTSTDNLWAVGSNRAFHKKTP